MALKKLIYQIIESPDPEDWRGKSFDDFMIVLIVTNVLAVVLETVVSIRTAYETFFLYFEYFSVAVFSVEYMLRIWTAGQNEDERFHPPILGRIRYAMTPLALIDIIAILPFYLAFILSVDLRFMRVFRLLRLLKLTRYSAALQMLGTAVYGQRRALGAALMIIVTLLVFASSVIYLLEKEAQPEAFGSIP
jgi:voltage-gated potassium channel